MKKTLTFLAILIVTTLFAQTYVPDDNFEAYLETHNAAGTVVPLSDPTSMGNGIANDDYVFTNRIDTVTSLDVNTLSITDLTGIEDFVALTELLCYSNSLTSLDVTQNTALTDLNCYNNNLTSLDVSVNTALQNLSCGSNQLSNLEVSQNINLLGLYFQNNQLTNLDISQNTALTALNSYSNQLTSLDVSANTALYSLSCRNNNLTSLDVAQNTALAYLYCQNNNLTSLDVTQNTSLTTLLCQNNQLNSLNIQNGNNTNILDADFNATNNPDLNCILVDDAAWSTTNWSNIGATSTFVNNQAECDALASVSENNLESQITIFPNPANNETTINIDENAEMKFFNISGKVIKIHTLKQGSNIINLSKIDKGIYFIKITNNNISATKKLILK